MRLTDRFLRDPSPPTPAEQAEVRQHFTDPEIVESMLALSLFVGFSKMMIALGLEPEQMDTTVWATPDLPEAERSG